MAHTVLTRPDVQTRRPFGQTSLLALGLLMLLVALAELLARTPFARYTMVAPSLGRPIPQLGAKWEMLKDFVRAEGGVDCIFLGSSLPLRGLDPDIVELAYAQETGARLRCFNFGMSGINSDGVGLLAQVLASEFHPSLLIYATTFRDFEDGTGFDISGPWFDYRLGRSSVQGWLIDTSYAYRYYLTYRNWGTQSFERLLAIEAEFEAQVSADGYWPGTEITLVDRPPDPQEYARSYAEFEDYRPGSRALAGLEQLVGLNGDDLQVVIVEMPMPPTAIAFLGRGDLDYQVFVNLARGRAAAGDVPVWLTTDLDLIPADGWMDYLHLNRQGSRVFSAWLGRRLGEAAQTSPH